MAQKGRQPTAVAVELAVTDLEQETSKQAFSVSGAEYRTSQPGGWQPIFAIL